jgi:hypothetical protein
MNFPLAPGSRWVYAPRMKWWGILVVAMLLLAGCSSSGGSTTAPPAVPSTTTDAYTPPSIPTDDAGGEAVLDNLKCSEWPKIGSALQESSAEYYLLKYGDTAGFQTDGPSVSKLITTTCASYGDKESPAHIVKITWKTYIDGGGN